MIEGQARHGESARRKKTIEYRTWCAMIERCERAKNPCYHLYGGRGIKVCGRWRNSFEAFLEDVGRRPSSRHSLDRIDNNDGYRPGNVRWATWGLQSRNTRRNVIVTIEGVELCLKDAARVRGISYSAVVNRARRGWTLEEALELKARPRPSKAPRDAAGKFSRRSQR
jgi:hypothetical protein